MKHLVENTLHGQIDRYNVLDVLDLSDKLGAIKIKKSALLYLANNFELFSSPDIVGQS